MMTATLTRSERYDVALDCVQKALHEAATAHKACKPDPYANEYIYWRKTDLACVLVVKHRLAANSYEVSRDGGDRRVYLPFSKTTILSESHGDFCMALLSRRYVRWLEQKDAAAGSRLAELFGITLPLSETREWTSEQCETWQRLSNRRMSIITRTRSAHQRRRYSNISRSDAA